jgi:hypothetical protein
LYNTRRPHQALGHRSPMTIWREAAFANAAVDMTLRLDKAPKPSIEVAMDRRARIRAGPLTVGANGKCAIPHDTEF